MSDERTGERAGADQAAEDRSRHLADPVRQVDLADVARELREGETWRREGHVAKTLVKNESLRVVLVDMREGAQLREHRTASRISIHVLGGKVSVRMPGGSRVVAAGQLLAVDESIPHDVEALEPSTFLLTLARSRDEAAGEPH